MPQSKKEVLLLSFIMSLIMIYVMAALNISIREGKLTGEAWLVSLERLPIGFLVGILCDLLICTPLSRKIVMSVTDHHDKASLKIFILRFSMVILITIAMTIFSVFASGKLGTEGIVDFFTYLPYNFTIALPIQMLIAAPFSARLAKQIAK